MKVSKYTCLGNTALVVDEMAESVAFSEEDRVHLVKQLADPDYGMGTHIVAFVRPMNFVSDDMQLQSNRDENVRGFSEDAQTDTFGVRYFLPSGDELLISGGGLIAVASHLYHRFDLHDAWLVCDYPLGNKESKYVYSEMWMATHITLPLAIPYRYYRLFFPISPITDNTTVILSVNGDLSYSYYSRYDISIDAVCGKYGRSVRNLLCR